MPTVYVKLGGLCWPKRGTHGGHPSRTGGNGIFRVWVRAQMGLWRQRCALLCFGMPWDAMGCHEGDKICPNKYPINQISKMLLMSGVRSFFFLHQLARALEVLQTSQ